MKAALYARVSTADQTCQQQLTALREYAGRLGFDPIEYIDQGESGSKASRPALDRLLGDCARKKVRAVLVTKLDRLGRSVRHLVSTVEELDRLGVRFICTDQGIDTEKGNPAGRLLLHILASVAEFERELIRERTRAGLARVKAAGTRLGRPVAATADEDIRRLRSEGLSVRRIAGALGLKPGTVYNRLTH